MIKPKAPKDMTAVEFVEYLIARKEDEKVLDVNVYYTLEFLKGRLNEPAPNPFTPDQLAWMREEQRTGMNYAYKATNWYIFCCSEKPEMRDGNLRDLSEDHSAHKANFLTRFLDVNEFICFADYAPLEEKK